MREGGSVLKQPVFWGVLILSTVAAYTARGFFQNHNKLYQYSKDFPEILHLVDLAYVDEVNMKELMPGVFQGALERLDENACYLPPGKEPSELGDKVFERTGLVITKRFGYAQILAMATPSPASEAGLRNGLYLRTINGLSTREMSLHGIQEQLAAERNLLELTVVGSGETNSWNTTLEPGSFEIPKISSVLHGDGLHLIQIPHFYKELDTDLRKAILIHREKTTKLVLDLRNNAMGEEQELRLLASFFLPQGKIASRVNAKKKTVEILNPTEGHYPGQPGFIIIDSSTSKAAEAFCAIAQELNKTVVVGEASRGYPVFYRTFPLESGGYIRMAIQNLALNSGRLLTGEGVKPDLVVDSSKEVASEDLLLNLALEKIRSGLKKAS